MTHSLLLGPSETQTTGKNKMTKRRKKEKKTYLNERKKKRKITKTRRKRTAKMTKGTLL